MLEIAKGSPETLAKLYSAVQKRETNKRQMEGVTTRKPMTVYRRSDKRKNNSVIGNLCIIRLFNQVVKVLTLLFSLFFRMLEHIFSIDINI